MAIAVIIPHGGAGVAASRHNQQTNTLIEMQPMEVKSSKKKNPTNKPKPRMKDNYR